MIATDMHRYGSARSCLSHCFRHGAGRQSPQSGFQRSRRVEGYYKGQITPHWFAENKCFWYRNDLSGGAREFIVVNAEQGTRQPAFDHAELAAGSVQGRRGRVQGRSTALRRHRIRRWRQDRPIRGGSDDLGLRPGIVRLCQSRCAHDPRPLQDRG